MIYEGARDVCRMMGWGNESIIKAQIESGLEEEDEEVINETENYDGELHWLR